MGRRVVMQQPTAGPQKLQNHLRHSALWAEPSLKRILGKRRVRIGRQGSRPLLDALLRAGRHAIVKNDCWSAKSKAKRIDTHPPAVGSQALRGRDECFLELRVKGLRTGLFNGLEAPENIPRPSVKSGSSEMKPETTSTPSKSLSPSSAK
jgi:hypothetical protein